MLTLNRDAEGVFTSARLDDLDCDVCGGATGISLSNSLILNGQAETAISLSEDEQALFSYVFVASGLGSASVAGLMQRTTVPSPQRTLYGFFTAVRWHPAP